MAPVEENLLFFVLKPLVGVVELYPELPILAVVDVEWEDSKVVVDGRAKIPRIHMGVAFCTNDVE